MNIRINGSMQCEIDQRKSHCKEEKAHCHITRNGRPVAQVCLDTLRIEAGHSLDREEMDLVLSTVANHKYDMRRQYYHNSQSGEDY